MRSITRPHINRPLKRHERAAHLPQDKPAPIPVAWPQTSVIRMNSTYLECVDYYFMRKGMPSIFSIMILPFTLGLPIHLVLIAIEQWPELTGSKPLQMILLLAFAFICMGGLSALIIHMLRFECFNYTHYPIRFNRKTRMVHAFLPWEKGRFISIPWDEVFFAHNSQKHDSAFAINGHKLSEDKKNVLESFLLPVQTDWDSEFRFMQWEFIRQYMEGGDERVGELAKMVGIVMNVGDRHESPYQSLRNTLMSFGAESSFAMFVLCIIILPLPLLVTFGRIIAIWTSKVPRWPAEIEATSQYSPDDPNLRDGKHLTSRKDMPSPPDMSQYAGV